MVIMLVALITPVSAATSTVSSKVLVGGVYFNRQVEKTTNASGTVVKTVTTDAYNGMILRVPAIPLTGVISGTTAISNKTITLNFYSPTASSPLKSVNVPVTIVEETKLTGV